VLNFEEHSEDAEATLAFRRLKEAIHAGGGALAHVEEAGGDETVALKHAQHAAFAWTGGGIRAEEGFEIVGDVVREALFVALEQRAQIIIENGRGDVVTQVGVLGQHAALAFREGTGRKVDAQRRYGLCGSLFVGLGAVSKEIPAKMPPARRRSMMSAGTESQMNASSSSGVTELQ
jgi:hypothetical protein